MADLEKLTALKKAYAEIILNTAKDAAARIMVSERKAARYQCELFAAKDEALRMLLRLKQMVDSKVTEAEMESLGQQRRIDELEAQLGEAEDIVKDLRAELRELQDELEKVTSNRAQPLGGWNSEGHIATHVVPLGENRLSKVATQAAPLEENQLSTSRSLVYSLPAAYCDPPATLEMRPSTLNGMYNSSNCDNENGSLPGDSFVCNTDFASIVMRSKEPELYRNGCTQRIRAFERSLLGGNLSLSGQCDNPKNQLFITEDEEDKHTHKKSIVMADSMCNVQKRVDDIKVIQENINCIQIDHIPSSRRKRKIATRYRRPKTPSSLTFPDQDVAYNIQSGEDYRNESHMSRTSTSNMCNIEIRVDDVKVIQENVNCIQIDHIPSSPREKKRATRCRRPKTPSSLTFPGQHVTNNIQSGGDCRTLKTIAQKDPESHMSQTSTSNISEMMKPSRSVEVTKTGPEFRDCIVHNTIKHNKLLVDELGLTVVDARYPESSESPTAKTDLKGATILSVKPGPEESNASDMLPSQTVNDKFLKYTFQRKRKKESPSTPDRDSSHETGPLKRKTGENKVASQSQNILAQQLTLPETVGV